MVSYKAFVTIVNIILEFLLAAGGDGSGDIRICHAKAEFFAVANDTWTSIDDIPNTVRSYNFYHSLRLYIHKTETIDSEERQLYL